MRPQSTIRQRELINSNHSDCEAPISRGSAPLYGHRLPAGCSNRAPCSGRTALNDFELDFVHTMGQVYIRKPYRSHASSQRSRACSSVVRCFGVSATAAAALRNSRPSSPSYGLTALQQAQPGSAGNEVS